MQIFVIHFNLSSAGCEEQPALFLNHHKMEKTKSIRLAVLLLLIVAAAFSRIIPHPFNFSPLGAIALFGAAHFSKKWLAFFVPLFATWLSDLVLNNTVYADLHSGFQWISGGFYWMYGSYLLITLAGIFILKKRSPARIGLGALVSTGLFFLITNFGCWLGSKTFTQDFSGLLQCYAFALPFLKGTLAGDLLYVTILFGIFAVGEKRFPALRNQTV